MLNKHFFKILLIFIGMIFLGIAVFFLVGFFGGVDNAANVLNINSTPK